MIAETILVPTDFSDHSRFAIDHATALARNCGAELLIVHVKEDSAAYLEQGFDGIRTDDDDAQLNKLLSRVKPSDLAVGYGHLLLTGNAAEEIVRAARECNADMIVLGSHGRTGLTRLLMGSVAEAVIRNAGCPVLTVKHPALGDSG